MCAILILQPNFTPPFEMIENAARNNPHGYGLVLKDSVNKRLQVIKKTPENGNDPEEIYNLLKKHEDIERFLHVRWKTMGDVSEDNTQPFCVFHSNKRQLYFMHNGTLHSQVIPEAQREFLEEVSKEASDSQIFAKHRLFPFFQRMKGNKGFGDINDPFVIGMLGNMWPSSGTNRGLLISNDQDYVRFNPNDWKEIETKTGEKFFASNNEYFEKTLRGPWFEEQRRKEQEARIAESRERTQARGRSYSGDSNGASRVPMDGITRLTSPSFQKKYGLSEKISDLLEDHNMYTVDGYIQLANLTVEEMENLVKSAGDDLVFLMVALTNYLKEHNEECEEIKAKLAEVTKELKELREFKGEVHVG